MLLLAQERKPEHTPLPPQKKNSQSIKPTNLNHKRLKVSGLNAKITMTIRSLKTALRLPHGCEIPQYLLLFQLFQQVINQTAYTHIECIQFIYHNTVI